MSWSTARNWSTDTPSFSIRPTLRSINPWVLLTSGDRLRVQLTNKARRPLNRGPSCGDGSVISPRYAAAVPLRGGSGERSRLALDRRRRLQCRGQELRRNIRPVGRPPARSPVLEERRQGGHHARTAVDQVAHEADSHTR